VSYRELDTEGRRRARSEVWTAVSLAVRSGMPPAVVLESVARGFAEAGADSVAETLRAEVDELMEGIR
jgi:hypothetical protein